MRRALIPATVFLIPLALAALPRGRADEKPAAGKVIMLFNGNDLKGWKLRGDAKRSQWVVGKAALDEKDSSRLLVTETPPGKGELVDQKHSVDIYTEQKFGDCTVEIEFMYPKGSNSGVYLMGEYEVQILDSYGRKKVGPGDLGGIYATAAPRVNAAKKSGEWQKFVIEFRAPRFQGGKKTSNARFVKVTLNGEVIHEDVEVKGPTPACLKGREVPTGPLMLQGDHGPVAFRNIRITPRVE
jgi:hypothetical protein